ncbi:mid region of cactin-domain-containing protein [Exophiala viscosa]|uniref:Splicing factor Cactin n=1 Tax=Exophiala viscosa TaxID=2486360 RepID=A0AAN6IA92_9EURO|nr:mid region of cactin-domain-containing protein [Exophiala viscosa]
MSDYASPGKRKRSQSPPPWRKHDNERKYRGRDAPRNPENGQQQRWSHKDQMRINQLQEDERMREWVAQEDDFVLKQAKKKADIRVKEGRAKPIDWLAVTLRVVDPTRDPLDDEVDEKELDFVDPDSVFDGLDETELSDLRKDIETYMSLEKNRKNRDYWRTMQIICKDRQKRLRVGGPEGRAVTSVASDIDKLLGPKTYEQLEVLEGQIRTKLDSNEPIDTDYWQQLLDSLLVWKAKAKLKKVYQDVLDSRLKQLREVNEQEALQAQQTLRDAGVQSTGPVAYSKELDPDPLLEIPSKDKGLEVIDESAFLKDVASSRRKVLNMGYVPAPKTSTQQKTTSHSRPTGQSHHADPTSRFDRSTGNDDISSATKALLDREVAKGVNEDEEIFAGEEDVTTGSKPLWSGKHRPRKPKYFNRVQMGYEWNKYNQTHYDHDNPPPKVVQGYKFHIFYPDLIDPTKAPTYKIIREGGRKKGQTMAPAGEEDTCIIRFMSGPPYEDIAFRIVDRDWDYSAKHDRGFKSTFEKGILTLHFSFKRIVYRK